MGLSPWALMIVILFVRGGADIGLECGTYKR
jgi:hypothetical protein